MAHIEGGCVCQVESGILSRQHSELLQLEKPRSQFATANMRCERHLYGHNNATCMAAIVIQHAYKHSKPHKTNSVDRLGRVRVN